MNRTTRIRLLFLSLLILLVAVIVVIVLQFVGKPPRYQFQSVNINPNTHPSMQGNDLLYYNGIAFYSTDVATGKTTRKSPGLFLPQPSAVYYGKTGAIATFDDYSDSDLIGQYINTHNLSAADTRSLIWYINFSNGQLSLINGIEGFGEAIYIPDSNQFIIYSGSVPAQQAQLYAFNPSGLTVAEINEISGLSLATNFFSCLNTACLAGSNKKGEAVVYAIHPNSSDLIATLPAGEALSTNDQKYIAFIKTSAPEKDDGDLEDQDVGQEGPSDSMIINLETTKQYKLGATTAAAAVFVGQDQGIVILSNSTTDESRNYYYSGVLRPNKKSALVKEHPSNLSSQDFSILGSSGDIGFVKADNKYYLIKPTTSTSSLGESLKEDSGITQINRCTNSAEISLQGTTVHVTLDSDGEFKTLQNCFVNNSGKPFSYSIWADIIPARTAPVLD